MNYAAKGMQETCIVFALPGFFVWVFGQKVKPVQYAKRPAAPAKRRRKPKAKKAVIKRNLRTEKPGVRENRITQKPKAKHAKRSEPDPSPEFILRADRCRAGRDGRTFENDNW